MPKGVARPKPHLQPVLSSTNTTHRAAGPLQWAPRFDQMSGNHFIPFFPGPW